MAARIWYQSFTDPKLDAPYFERLRSWVTPIFIPYHEQQVALHGLRERVVAITAVDTEVADYDRAFEDPDVYAELRQRFLRELVPLVDAGIDVIVPAGGLPMLLFARERGLSVREAVVVNGIPVSLLAAETAIRLRRFQVATASRTGAYALPSAVTGIVAVVAFVWLAVAASTHSLLLLVPALLLYGVSIPAADYSAVTVAQNVASDEHGGQASGIVTSAAQAGAPIGVALVGTVVVAVSGSQDYTMAGFQAGFLACAAVSAVIIMLAFTMPRFGTGQSVAE